MNSLTAVQQMQRARQIQALEATPPAVRAMIADEVIASQRSIIPQVYYSSIRFRAVRTGAGPFTYTVDNSTRKAFVYKEGDVMDAAGFSTGTVATRAETNLTSGGSQTNDNSDVVVWGIGIEVAPNSEPVIAAQLLRQAFVEMSLNGSQRFLLGKIQDFPAAGGLYGVQRSLLTPQPLAEVAGPLVGFVNNGNPMAGNFWKLPMPFRWNSIGSGKKDTALAFSITPGAAFTFSSTDRAAVAGAAPGSSGQVVAYTSPADGAAGTFVDLRVKLATIQIGERSLNA